MIMPDCLEKLYNTITQSKYRVVMSRAKMFGRFNGIFPQPSLSKLQMYGVHENCIVSALFYKEDFEKFGGYCTDFNGYGGDDMDYWLNYIDNDIPIIRLPDVLFLYRIKQDYESVWKNYKPAEQIRRYEYKEKKLLERHPKMRFWIRFYKFLHSKFCRFFFRIQHNKIKIFKIPVWNLKQEAYTMKKTIFTFWEPKENMPGYIKLCMQTWKKFLPDYDIVVLDYKNITNWFDRKTIRKFLYKKTSLPKQADCIRAALLYKYGGIWMDADTIITKPNFINSITDSDVLMIGTQTGVHGAFIYAAKPRANFITNWYAQVVKRVKIYRFVNLCKINRFLFKKILKHCENWDWFLNSILNPVVANNVFTEKDLCVLQRDKVKAFPEHLSDLNKNNIAPDKLYRDFYFWNKDINVSVKKIIENNQGVILLHNSWTPQEYKNMSPQEFLSSDANLAKILKELLK